MQNEYIYCKYATENPNGSFDCPYRYRKNGKPCPDDAGTRNTKNKLISMHGNEKYCRLSKETLAKRNIII